MKKFQGTYIEVINALQLSELFYGVSKPKEYDDQIAKDLHRICYVNLSGNVQGMKERLADRSNLAAEDLSYSQANFYGGVFTESAIKKSQYYFDTFNSADKRLDGDMGFMGFNYDDDNGRQCGISVAYLRDDSDQSISPEKRPMSYALALIKDVKKSPEQRQVTCFMDPVFLKSEEGEDIKKEAILRTLDQLIGSKSIAPLIKGLFNSNGTLSFAKYRELDARITPNHNIDNRDEKLDKLLDIYIMWARLASDQQKSDAKNKLLAELSGIMISAFTDINYFKDKSVQDVEQLVRTYKAHPVLISATSSTKFLDDYAINQGYSSFDELYHETSQSFLRHNAGPLILIGLALAVVVCVALTLTGILAPLGIVVGVTVLASALKIYDNEQDRKQKKEAIHELIGTNKQVVEQDVQNSLLTDRGIFNKKYQQAHASQSLSPLEEVKPDEVGQQDSNITPN